MEQSNTISLLSKEQLELRQTGIGASEIAGVLGISPWATKTDIWMRKRTATRGPLVDGNIDTMATRIGNVFEEPIRRYYEMETGLTVKKFDETLRHPDYHFILATPDGYAYPHERALEFTHGVEIKNVGARMMGAWEDGVPDYYELQCRQCMAVLGIGRWDVAAVLGGSQFVTYIIERDLDIEQFMIEGARDFWENYVEKDIAPPSQDPDAQRRLLQALFPKHLNKSYKVPTDPEYFKELCEEYANIQEQEKALKEEKTSVQNSLIEMVGDAYGIDDPYTGKVSYGFQQGRTNYKNLATDLAGGSISDALMEKYRGEGSRVFRFTAPKVGVAH